GLLVVFAALTSTNATIFTGARTNQALGRDFPVFSFMRTWKSETSSPINALLTQSFIAVFLIIVGSFGRSGFESMVNFTASIFCFFISCIGIALFVVRYKYPCAPCRFCVPLYPVLPVVFCLASLYMLYASLMFAGGGAWLGVTVLLLGTLFFFSLPKKNKKQ